MDYLSRHVMGDHAVEARDQVSIQIRNQQTKAAMGPVAILWDIENCPVPSEVRAEEVAGNIRVALRVHPAIRGAVKLFSAYGDFNNFPRKLREGCQRTGVNLIDVPNGKKDAADKAILVDMFLFALDNPSPSTILLISGDVDFAPALHKLGQRGYTVALVIPSGVGVSSALCSAGRFVWDWPSVAKGQGLVPAKSFLSRTPELACYSVGCLLNDDSDFLTDEEAIVYKGLSQKEYFIESNSAQAYTMHTKHMATDLSVTSLTGPSAQSSGPSLKTLGGHLLHPSSSMQSSLPITDVDSATIYACKPVPPSYTEDDPQSVILYDSNSAPNSTFSSFSSQSGAPFTRAMIESYSLMQNNLPITAVVGRSAPTSAMPSVSNSGTDSTSWVQPGDIQGLKRQIVNLIIMSGGSLLLGRVPSEYHKVCGRPLYLAEYGSCKLVNLIKKMSDTICIEGKGHKKFLCLREQVNDPGNSENVKASIDPYNRGSPNLILQEDFTAKTENKEIHSNLDLCNNLQHEDVGEDGVDINVGCYSDEGTEDERASEQEGRHGDDLFLADANAEIQAAEARLGVFKEELQELLVSHACKILLSSLLTLYRQRYGRELDYSMFGAKEVEDLIDKVGDIAIIEEDQGTQKKVLVANCGFGVDNKFKPHLQQL
ncbi:hypothetical protein SUGI_0994650 [Cryptomeria japonica]|uniref:uncharacterized protein LOC131049618 n=1 Tax=Cryptomeria japonica TaxID=3369 RepID=UPI0024147A1F|nr:uncharacterized protein LOC131049618 [Cryptomeria japonica]GLJ47101.1 hypothetical protein SUGI_0994650 [Cryptomeria japonica]